MQKHISKFKYHTVEIGVSSSSSMLDDASSAGTFDSDKDVPFGFWTQVQLEGLACISISSLRALSITKEQGRNVGTEQICIQSEVQHHLHLSVPSYQNLQPQTPPAIHETVSVSWKPAYTWAHHKRCSIAEARFLGAFSSIPLVRFTCSENRIKVRERGCSVILQSLLDMTKFQTFFPQKDEEVGQAGSTGLT
jgi:hypothetical protein